MPVYTKIIDAYDRPDFDVVTGAKLNLAEGIDDQDVTRFNLRESTVQDLSALPGDIAVQTCRNLRKCLSQPQ